MPFGLWLLVGGGLPFLYPFWLCLHSLFPMGSSVYLPCLVPLSVRLVILGFSLLKEYQRLVPLGGFGTSLRVSFPAVGMSSGMMAGKGSPTVWFSHLVGW